MGLLNRCYAEKRSGIYIIPPSGSAVITMEIAEPTRLAQKEKWRSRGWNKFLNVSMIASRYADGLCSNTCIYGTFEPVLC